MDLLQYLPEAAQDLFERLVEMKVYARWRAEEPEPKGYFDETTEFYIKKAFPFVYSGLIFYSAFGFFYQILQLFDIFLFKLRPVMLWRGEMIYGISHDAMRYIRVLGCLIMMVNWATLFYGLTKISASCLAPWVTINFTVLAVDSFLYAVEVLFKRQYLSFTSFLNYLFPAIVQFLAWRVKIVIENAANATNVKVEGSFFEKLTGLGSN